jgi:hypothetical protein
MSCRQDPSDDTKTLNEKTIERIRRAYQNATGYDPSNPDANKVKVFGSISNGRAFTLRPSDVFGTWPNADTKQSKTGEGEKIFKLLPGGGNQMVIPLGINWNSSVAGGPLKNSNPTFKIINSLLAQTMTMWFNAHASDQNLGNWILPEGSFTTYSGASCAEGSWNGGGDESDPIVVDPAFSGKSVFELLDMADEVLGGKTPISNGVTVTPSKMHEIMGKLVDAFHGCRSLGGINQYRTTLGGSRIEFGGPVSSTSSSEVTVKEDPKSDVVVKAFPNPYVDQIVFNIYVKNAGKGSLVLYNTVGQKVANVFEGNMQANSTQTIRYSVPVSQRNSLVFVFRQNGNTSTGRLVSGK